MKYLFRIDRVIEAKSPREGALKFLMDLYDAMRTSSVDRFELTKICEGIQYEEISKEATQ